MGGSVFICIVAENVEEWDNIDFQVQHTLVVGQFIRLGEKSYVVNEVWDTSDPPWKSWRRNIEERPSGTGPSQARMLSGV